MKYRSYLTVLPVAVLLSAVSFAQSAGAPGTDSPTPGGNIKPNNPVDTTPSRTVPSGTSAPESSGPCTRHHGAVDTTPINGHSSDGSGGHSGMPRGCGGSSGSGNSGPDGGK
jgi:hypothetical protein